MHHRLATEFARIEQKYPNPMDAREIYDLFKDFKYIVPQGSPMSGIGNQHQVQSISNCFVIDAPHDSYGGILKADQELVQIAKKQPSIKRQIKLTPVELFSRKSLVSPKLSLSRLFFKS